MRRRDFIAAVSGATAAWPLSASAQKRAMDYCAVAWAHAEGRMPAYIIAEHTITDPAKFEEYRTKVGPIIAKHGGRYITKPGSHVILEREHAVWQPERVVIIEFPDMAALNAWYRSPEYQPLIPLRQTAAKDMLITLEGA